jgi:hypothetical protein
VPTLWNSTYTTSTYPVTYGYNAWPTWCEGTGATATASTNVWNDWLTYTVNATTTITSQVWQEWAAQPYLGYRRQRVTAWTPPPPPSPREQSISETRTRVSMMRERVAARRARRLLLDHLDAVQSAELAVEHCFHVETADGRRRYRIRQGVAGNVELVRDGDRVAAPGGRLGRYCCHIEIGGVPAEDHMLVQKLMLEANEPEFLRLANWSP